MTRLTAVLSLFGALGALVVACTDAATLRETIGSRAEQVGAAPPGVGGGGTLTQPRLFWKDATGATVNVVAPFTPLTVGGPGSSGGTSSSSGGSSAPAPFGTLLVADANGFVWQTTPDGAGSALATAAVEWTGSSCTGTAYVNPQGLPGPRFVVAVAGQGFYSLPDTALAVTTVTTLQSSFANGACFPNGGPFSDDVVPLTALRSVAAPPATLFAPPAHPEFL